MNNQKTNQILVAGLGNLGKQYQNTRHNLGFLFLDWLLNTINQTSTEKKSFKIQKKLACEVVVTTKAGQKIFLAKPQTFMNKSGFAVKKISDFYKIPLENIIVIHDDLDLPFGTFRVSKNSGSAGHNGVQSIIAELGSKDFIRLRFGISNEQKNKIPGEQFVLDNFSAQEQATIEETLLKEMRQALDNLLEKGFVPKSNQAK